MAAQRVGHPPTEPCSDPSTSTPNTTGESPNNGTGTDPSTSQTVIRAWLDVVEVSFSVSEGASASGQAGVAEGTLSAGAEAKVTVPLGFDKTPEVETFGGVDVKGKVPGAEGEIKAGGELSSNDGATLKAEAGGSAGPVSGSVSVDKNGVHRSAELEKKADIKLGAHVNLGLGVGANVNLSQLRRAVQATNASISAAFSAVSGYLGGLNARAPTLSRSPFPQFP
jgi:hypothetical protein